MTLFVTFALLITGVGSSISALGLISSDPHEEVSQTESVTGPTSDDTIAVLAGGSLGFLTAPSETPNGLDQLVRNSRGMDSTDPTVRWFGSSNDFDGDTAVVGDSQGGGSNQGVVYVYVRGPNGAWVQQDRLIPDEPRTMNFGKDVAVDGDTIVVGDPQKGDGAAFIFTRDASGKWSQQADLRPPGSNSDSFGWWVDVEGDRAVIGAPHEGPGRHGEAFVYVRDGTGEWLLEAHILPEDPTTVSFGMRVALDGDTLVASDTGAGSNDEGAVFVFTLGDGGTWAKKARLVPSDPSILDVGISVAISGDTVLIGDWGAGLEGTGRAYVFVRDAEGGWSEQATLAPEDPTSRGFGIWVAVDGDVALVGDAAASPGGAVFAFTRGTQGDWGPPYRLVPIDPTASSFGWSVSLEGDTALVGDLSAGATDPGAAYVFNYTLDGSWDQQARLFPAETVSKDLGHAVAVSGETAVVGDPNTGANGSGETALFTRDAEGAWSREGTLTPSHPAAQSSGASVAIDGDIALVGDPDAGTGVVDVFNRDAGGTWRHEAQLAPIPATSPSFGYAIDLSQDTAVVGAPSPGALGSAYVFSRGDDGTWSQEARLTPDDPAFAFGFSVAIDSGTVVVGDPDGGTDLQGAAFVFAKNGEGSWVQETRLVPLDPTIHAYGTSVAIDESTIIVGDEDSGPVGVPNPLADELTGGPGAAYVFTQKTDRSWSFTAKLLPPTMLTNRDFGGSVAVNGSVAIVGDPSATYPDDGAAYLFSRDDEGRWRHQTKLQSVDPSINNFGRSVALDSDTVVVGDPNGGANNEGTAYLFWNADDTWAEKTSLADPSLKEDNSI